MRGVQGHWAVDGRYALGHSLWIAGHDCRPKPIGLYVGPHRVVVVAVDVWNLRGETSDAERRCVFGSDDASSSHGVGDAKDDAKSLTQCIAAGRGHKACAAIEVLAIAALAFIPQKGIDGLFYVVGALLVLR